MTPFRAHCFKLFLGLTLLLSPSAAFADDYRVRVGDSLEISVFQYPEYSGESRVDNDGIISLPALGRLKVADLPLNVIEDKVAERLREGSGLPAAHVVAKVSQYRPFSILGAVNEPGRYPYESGMTVLDAVAVARGFFTLRSDWSETRYALEFADRQEQLDLLLFDLWVQLARQARLRAEKENLDEITFPDELLQHRATNDMAEILAREKARFTARKNDLSGQIEFLVHQSTFLEEEIKALDEHTREIQRSVNFFSKELNNQSSLLEQGLARRTTMVSMQKELTDMQGEYRQSVVAVKEAQRERIEIDKAKLRIEREREAEIDDDLLETETQISMLKRKIEHVRALLDNNMVPTVSASQMLDDSDDDVAGFRIEILRESPADGQRVRLQDVAETTPIMGGDILKVTIVK